MNTADQPEAGGAADNAAPDAGWSADASAVALLVAAAAILSWTGFHALDPAVFEARNFNVWFQADLPRVFEQMSTRWHSADRTDVHPLFSIFAHPPVLALHKVLGVSLAAAIAVELAALAALWSGLLYAVLRVAGWPKADALVFALLGTAGASSTFWLSVPETFGFGSAGILLTALAAALEAKKRRPDWWQVAAGVLNYAFTVTNVAITGLLAFLTRRPKRAIQICLSVVAVALIVWAAGTRLFPNLVRFIPEGGDRFSYAVTPERIAREVGGFFVVPAVAPVPVLCINVENAAFPGLQLSTGSGGPGSFAAAGLVAAVLWLLLLAFGAYAAVRSRMRGPLLPLLAGWLALQFALHAVYGGELFLYSMHWWPVLVLLAAHASRTRLRKPVLVLTAAVVLLAGLNSIQQRNAAAGYLSGERELVATGTPCRA